MKTKFALIFVAFAMLLFRVRLLPLPFPPQRHPCHSHQWAAV